MKKDPKIFLAHIVESINLVHYNISLNFITCL
jgi:hypothetical protein